MKELVNIYINGLNVKARELQVSEIDKCTRISSTYGAFDSDRIPNPRNKPNDGPRKNNTSEFGRHWTEYLIYPKFCLIEKF